MLGLSWCRVAVVRVAAAIRGCFVVACCVAAQAAPLVVETEPLPPEAQQQRFRLPEGFEIQLVAAEPTIQKPMNMAFDGRGRLWVTHSVEYPWAAADGSTPRDGLTILEDFGPDGRARKSTRFADGLNIPMGVLPLPEGNAAIVWSIPNIWLLTDDDGDGRADRREVLYGPFGFTDVHGNQNGFRLGADGWVYANHGFNNHSQVKLRGEGPVVLEMKSGNGYRFRPDGSAIEQITWGQVNPFGMDFDALGNRFNADCHSRPLAMLLRGGRYLSPFGPRNDDYDDGLGLAPDTTSNDHGSTGIAAVAICDTGRMPAEFRGSVFIGNVVTNVVHRDPIAWRGSSPWVTAPQEFLGCNDEWFRPVDLAFGPDGVLYVADFYNCIVGHYEVDLRHPRRDRERGRIWRVVRKGAEGPAAMPDCTRLPAADLVALLDADDETVRRLAFEQVVVRGRTDASIPPLLRAADAGEHRRARALRALARLGLLTEADATARDDASRLVRVHQVKAAETLAEREPAWAKCIVDRLGDPDPFVRRAAAEALVARPSLAAVPALVAAARVAAPEDRQFVHALKMAITAPLRTAGREPLGGLVVEDADRPLLLEIVCGLPGRELACYGLELARRDGPSGAFVDRICANVARCGEAAEVETAVAFARGACGDDLERNAAILRMMLDARQQARLPVPADGGLADWVRWLLGTAAAGTDGPRPSDAVVRVALAAAAMVATPSMADVAVGVVEDPARPVAVRGEAAAVALSLDRDRAADAIAARLVDPRESAAARVAFAGRIAALERPAVREALDAALTSASAAEQRDLAIVSINGRAGADAVLALVERGKVSARLLQDPQIARLLGEAGVPDVQSRIDAVTAGLPSADERVREVIQRVVDRVAKGEGSAEAGAAVFARSCAACHRHGGVGGLVGPQLDGVGQRGPQRLLEDILDPNRNVDEAFRTTVVTLADGRVVSGLKIRDEAQDLLFVDAAGKEFRVPRGEVEEATVTRLSPMPANMADQVGEAALPDLIAYLRGPAGR